ncbi:protein timeless homolog [Lycorma delicatula]|uniref:protein timeless homolog n=1 Tax=Lycorma delicatula TaxID=130591 RepID=UPI003F514B28
MITGQLSAELSATCSALGHYDGITYHIDPYCKETVKDLIKFLRRDDDEHSVRRYLGHSKVLQTDLLPIIIYHPENQELFDVVLRLLMNLTSPALIVYQEHIPTDKNERNHYLQIVSHLQDYKQAFIKPEIWEVLAKKLSELLEMDYLERDEDVHRMMERILILARNVLAVPSDPENEKRPDNDATTHDKVLWAMHESNMAEIFLYIASSDKEQHVYMHILEIVSLMLREQKPSVLAKSAVQRSFSEKEKDEEELLAFRQAEVQLKQMKVKKYAGARHGSFGGTFVMKGIKAAGDKDLIFHKPLEKAMSLDFNFEKKRIKKPKNLQPLKHVSEERRSTFGVRLFLKEFCIDFLNGAYNPLMKKVKDIIERGKSQGDESYYFWAMRFFMEFNRNYNFQIKFVSETVSIETFHFVQTQLEIWNDLMTIDKKKIPLLSRRMHLALNAYQELLLTLMAMDKSEDENVQNSSRILKSRVFYVTEYRDLLLILLHVFKENRFSRCYIKDLIETIHIFMKLLENYTEKHRGGLIIETKTRINKKRKSEKTKSNNQSTVNLEAIWDQVGPQLSVILQENENIPTDIVPFDALSDVDIDSQK